MKTSCPELIAWIDECTPKLKDTKFTLSTKIHWIFMGITDFPRCANKSCNHKFGHESNVSWRKGYTRYCSLKCGVNDSREKCSNTLHKHAKDDPSFFYNIEQKRKATKARRYNDPNWNNRKSAHKTCMERLGSKCPIGNKDVLAKSLRTREQKYGKGNLTNHKKTRETCLAKYGYDNVWKVPEVHKKCIDTTIKLHGSSNPGNRYEFDGQKFDSKPELAYYIWLKDNNIQFTYKPSLSFSYEHDGSNYRYFPDFIVEGQVVEIKGDHFFKEDGTMCNPWDHSLDALSEAKHQCMIKNNVVVVCSDEYQKYLDYVSLTYGKDYISSFKKTTKSA